MTDDPSDAIRMGVIDGCELALRDLAEASVLLERAGAALGVEERIRAACAHIVDARDASSEVRVRALIDALRLLAEVLARLQTTRSIGATTDGAAELVAQAMVTLYPLRRALETAMESERTAIPLSKPKRRPVLELVPEADILPAAEKRHDGGRVALDVDIGLHSHTNFFTGFGDDVSEGGLFVATYQPLPIGTDLTLSFVLPDGPQVTARGRVSWIREAGSSDGDAHPGMGVAFTSVDAAGLAGIRRYIAYRAPLFYSD